MARNTITGTAGADTLHGTAGQDYINGLSGDDLMYGRGGDDHMEGGQGHDTQWGGAGDDVIAGLQKHGETGGDLLIGQSGNDWLEVDTIGDTVTSGAGDTLNGGSGDDTLVGVSGPELVSTMLAGAGDDDIYVVGSTGLSVGGGGNDTIYGEAGPDLVATVLGGTGDDYVEIGGSVFFADGGGGHDTVDVYVSLQIDSDLAGLAHGGRMEFPDGSVIENFESGDVHLSEAADTIHLAGGVQFSVDGGGGDDLLTGNARGNVLYGGILPSGQPDGRDTLHGLGGDDTLHGGTDADLLVGGKGHDVYSYGSVADSTPAAPDLIIGVDHRSIDLSRIDANTEQFGHQHFTIVDAFTDQPGQLTVTYSAEDHRTHVSGDVNGDGVADMLILIKGDHTDPGEFVL